MNDRLSTRVTIFPLKLSFFKIYHRRTNISLPHHLPKSLIMGLDFGPTQPTPPHQPNVRCTLARLPSLQSLNTPFWCNDLLMWDCKNLNFEKVLMVVHQHHRPTMLHLTNMYIYIISIKYIYKNKYYKLYTYIIN